MERAPRSQDSPELHAAQRPVGGQGPAGAGSERTPAARTLKAEGLPYPALAPVVFFCRARTAARPDWCLHTVITHILRGTTAGLGGPQGSGPPPEGNQKPGESGEVSLKDGQMRGGLLGRERVSEWFG